MRKGIYFLLFAMIVISSSCKKKKEETTPFPPASAAVVKSVSQTPSGESHTYSYDSEGRLAKIESWDGTSKIISYSNDTVTETNYNDSMQVVSVNLVILDAAGLATSSFLTDTNGTLLSRNTYAYDTASIKIGERNYDASNNLIAHQEWSITDNNVYYYTFRDDVNAQNNFELGYDYTYDSDNTIGNGNMGMKYYGNSSKNVMIKQIKHGYSYTSFQYTFDGSGRIATRRAYNQHGVLLNTNTYTYN